MRHNDCLDDNAISSANRCASQTRCVCVYCVNCAHQRNAEKTCLCGGHLFFSFFVIFFVLSDSGVVANIALIATPPVPDCLYSGCNLCRAWEKGLLLLRKHTQPRHFNELNTSQLSVSLRYLRTPPLATLSALLQPILDGKKRQNAATVGNN